MRQSCSYVMQVIMDQLFILNQVPETKKSKKGRAKKKRFFFCLISDRGVWLRGWKSCRRVSQEKNLSDFLPWYISRNLIKVWALWEGDDCFNSLQSFQSGEIISPLWVSQCRETFQVEKNDFLIWRCFLTFTDTQRRRDFHLHSGGIWSWSLIKDLTAIY